MVAGLVAAVTLYWVVLTAFRSGQINAIDFTVYFDRPAFQTLHGRPLLVESTDIAAFANRTALAIHAYWTMLPLAGFTRSTRRPSGCWRCPSWPSWQARFTSLRIAQHLRLGGPLACATAFAFLLNDNTARTLGYGFHAEVLYAWFVPWMLDAGLRRKPVSFLAATLLCVSVKEDAVMPIFGVCAALALEGGSTMTWRARAAYLIAPLAIALGNLVAYYRWLVPALSAGGTPFYAAMWSNYGGTPIRALLGMAASPWTVVGRAAGSGFFRKVIVPHLFLPLIGWRWTVGIVPIVLLYGASTNEQLRTFGIYYAIVLVPFLVVGASVGAATVARWLNLRDPRSYTRRSDRHSPRSYSAETRLAVADIPCAPGGRRSPRVPAAVAELSAEPVVFVQSGLYTRAGYQSRVRLLTPQAVRDPANAGAVALVAPDINAYPLTRNDVSDLARLDSSRSLGSGLFAVRLPR